MNGKSLSFKPKRKKTKWFFVSWSQNVLLQFSELLVLFIIFVINQKSDV